MSFISHKLLLLVFLLVCPYAYSQSFPEIMIVGTLHSEHLAQPQYPLSYLGRLIEIYRPELILLEIRPEELAKGVFEDGPLEMTYVLAVSKQKKTKVGGIDWWTEEYTKVAETELNKNSEYERAAEKIWKQIDFPPSFVRAHDQKNTTLLAARKNLDFRFDQDPGWSKRQSWINHRTLEAVRDARVQRVMVFVGLMHRPELEQYLAMAGLKTRNPSELSKPIQESTSFKETPPEVIRMWQEGIVRMKASVKDDSLKTKIRAWETAVRNKGLSK